MRHVRAKLGRRFNRLLGTPAPKPGSAFPTAIDRECLPWLDRAAATVDEYVSRLHLDPVARLELRARLLHWQQMGYVTFKGLIDPRLADAYRADVDQLFRERQSSAMIEIEGHGRIHIRDATPEMLSTHHLRVMDFHNFSVAAKRIAMHRAIVDFLHHVFNDTPVVMQSLTFIHGSEQMTHQDYAYVVPAIPSHLAATWVALEDIHIDAGPLAYYPGSHTLPKFEWGNGLFFTPQSKYNELDFARYIENEAQRMNLRREVFVANKGDVFLWHGALAHGGSPVRDANFTRWTLVTHYSSSRGYPYDQRDPSVPPIAIEVNGGFVYGDPRWPAEEDSFRLTAVP
jgi:ectoine hydroxylase-related dioxygenase (phytanoyl-CoA dioxygenase family)